MPLVNKRRLIDLETNNGDSPKHEELIEHFHDFVLDENDKNITSIYWHDAVGEYCYEVDGKWGGYVPKLFIFHAGYEFYNRFCEYWNDYRNHEMYQIKRVRYYVALSKSITSENYKLILELFDDMVFGDYFDNQYRIWTLEALFRKFPDDEEYISTIQMYINKEPIITKRKVPKDY